MPVANSDELKQTNEIKMAVPLLDALDIDGVVITADALLTQRQFARYLIEDKQAHYHFTVKANQATLLDDLTTLFKDRQMPNAVTIDTGHGRIETRRIWVSSQLNDYLDFPYVGQAFAIERETINKKPVSSLVKWRMASPAKGNMKQEPKRSWRQIAIIGPLRIAVIIFLIGLLMKIGAVFAPSTARKTLAASGALPLESSKIQACGA